MLACARSGGGRLLAEAARAAAARWFDAQARLWLVAAMAAAVAVRRYTARMPRPAVLDGHLILPGMRRDTWFRTARLMVWRAEDSLGRARPGPRAPGARPLSAEQTEALVAEVAEAEWLAAFTTRPVRQMIEWLGLYADDAGRIDNVGRMLACYQLRYGLGSASAYGHWRAVRELGLVRQTQHSAGYRPGKGTRCARYVLCWPAARLPRGLPAEADGMSSAPLAAGAAAWDEHAACTLSAADEVEMVRYGSCRAPRTLATTPRTTGPVPGGDRCQSLSAYYLEVWPLYARGVPPSPDTSPESRPDRPRRARPGGISEEERARARQILDGCRSDWARQRDGQLPDGDDVAVLVALVALVLRYTTPGDVHQLLTDRVGTARELPGLLRWRLQGALRDHRRRRNIPADEDGALYDVKMGARAAESAQRHEASAAARAAARSAALAIRDRRRAELAKAWPTVAPTGPVRPPDAEPLDPAAVLDSADLALLRQGMANARASYGGHPPSVAQVLGGRQAPPAREPLDPAEVLVPADLALLRQATEAAQRARRTGTPERRTS